MAYQVFVKSRCKSPTALHISGIVKNHLNQRGAASGELEVELISKSKIHELNLKHRKKDYPTDVLSFPTAEFPEKVKSYGTLFLSCDIIKLNAKTDGKSFIEEFDFILKHGIDHLLGIHHKE